MILGISGLNASGKGEAVRFLEERSFYSLSLSDVIRQQLRDEGLDETRERMIETGNRLRAEGGSSVLADRTLSVIEPDRNYAIDSIRHPAEVEALRAGSRRFHLIWLESDAALRFDRLRARARPGDPETLERFRELEERELTSADPARQQLLAVREFADFVVRNDDSLENLHAQLLEVLRGSYFFERPSWDRYFMNIATTVASRSNCMKRKVAAVVTIDRRIVSTGYNGTPRGTRNCNEGGCPRCNSFAPGGTALDECFCSHGEENAITQASYHGVSLRGGTLYTTFSPCLQCTKMIINAGLLEVVYDSHYPLGDSSLALLREAKVEVRQLEV
jgi:dCMP deaminase